MHPRISIRGSVCPSIGLSVRTSVWNAFSFFAKNKICCLRLHRLFLDGSLHIYKRVTTPCLTRLRDATNVEYSALFKVASFIILYSSFLLFDSLFFIHLLYSISFLYFVVWLDMTNRYKWQKTRCRGRRRGGGGWRAGGRRGSPWVNCAKFMYRARELVAWEKLAHIHHHITLLCF